MKKSNHTCIYIIIYTYFLDILKPDKTLKCDNSKDKFHEKKTIITHQLKYKY